MVFIQPLENSDMPGDEIQYKWRLPDLLKDVVAFLATQVHGIKKRKVPITDNYQVPQSNYWVKLGIFGRKR